ncbi:MAG: hypothetical protein Q9185_004414 [Variospora sp. 1 TL-2023]
MESPRPFIEPYPGFSHPKQQSSADEAVFEWKDRQGRLGEAPTARQSIETTEVEKLNYGSDLHQQSGRDLRYPRIFRSYVDRNKQEAVTDEGASGADHEPAILWTTAVFNAVDIIGYYPSFYKKEPGNLLDLSCVKSSDVSAEFILDEPYGVLMHHFPQLAAFAQSSTTADCEAENIEVLRLKRKHVRLLCEHLKPHYDSGVMPSLKLLENDPPRIAFDMLWYVFKPGTDVYLQENGLVYTCVVADIYSNYDNEQNPAQINQTKLEYWVLDLWFLETDGTSVGRVPRTCRLYPYKGLREVVFLDVCPVSIWDAVDNGKRRESIMRRSKLLVKALQQGHLLVWYNGPVNVKRQASTPL